MKSKIDKGFRGYIFSRPFMEERVPQHVQNIVIRDYCSKKKYSIFTKFYGVCYGKLRFNVKTIS